MNTREEAIRGAGECLASAYVAMLGLDGTTIDEAARRALTPTGPNYEQLVIRIRKHRETAGLSSRTVTIGPGVNRAGKPRKAPHDRGTSSPVEGDLRPVRACLLELGGSA